VIPEDAVTETRVEDIEYVDDVTLLHTITFTVCLSHPAQCIIGYNNALRGAHLACVMSEG